MKKLILQLAILLQCIQVNGQWTQIYGPDGGTVLSFTNIGTNLFTGTEAAGVFHSQFNGIYWIKANGGLPVNCKVNSMTSKGQSIYAATNQGLFRSDDNGMSWNIIQLGTPVHEFTHVAVYDTLIFAFTKFNGYFRTNNDWQTFLQITGYNNVQSSVEMDGDLYIALSGPIYKSVNDGMTWTVYGSSNSFTTTALAAAGNRIFAASVGSIRTSVGGQNWTNLANGIPSLASSYVLSVMSNFLFAGTENGIYRYDLNTLPTGAWASINSGIPPQRIRAIYNDGVRLYAGIEFNGVYSSTDNGTTWSEVNSGLVCSHVNDIIPYGSSILAATRKGIYRSFNAGSTWTQMNINTLSQDWITCLITSGPNLLAGVGLFGTDGIYYTSNNGLIWSPAIGFGPNQPITKMTISGQNVIAGTVSSGVLVSNNNGMNWSSGNTGMGNQMISSLATGPGVVYASTGAGLFQSVDNGQSWSLSGNGLPPTSGSVSVVTSGDTAITAMHLSGLYLTTDGGLQWYQTGSGIPGNTMVRDLLIYQNIIIAGTDLGIYVSSDLGNTWTQFNDGLTTTKISKLYKDGNRIYAGTQGGSIFSHDNLLTGLSDVNPGFSKIKVFPNPLSTATNTATVNIEGFSSEGELEIISTKGQLLKQVQINSGAQSILLENFQSGIYLLKFTDKRNVIYGKLVIQD